MDTQELQDRIDGLEQAVLSQRGRQARADEDAAEAKAAAFQIEGRLLEAIEFKAALDVEEASVEVEKE